MNTSQSQIICTTIITYAQEMIVVIQRQTYLKDILPEVEHPEGGLQHHLLGQCIGPVEDEVTLH